MNIRKLRDKAYLVRIQLPTAERYADGRIKYVDRKKTLPSKSAAEEWAKQQKAKHRQTGSETILTHREVIEFQEAKEIVGGKDLREVARYFADRNTDRSSTTVDKVVDEFFHSEPWEKLAESTKNNQKSILNQFSRAFDEVPIGHVSVNDLYAYLMDIPHRVTRDNHRRVLRRLFGWCLRKRQGYLKQFPLQELEGTLEDFGTPKYFTVEETIRLFQVAAEHDPHLIPFLALGHFGGFRSSEITRLQLRDFLIEEKRINVRGEVAKRKRKGKLLPRLVEGLPDSLWKWLEAASFSGEVDCKNYIKRRKKLYDKANLPDINSAARHTFCTYAYAHTQDSGKCKKWTGHRGDDSVFLSRYAGLETKARGDEYFRILPEEKLNMEKKITKFHNSANWPTDTELIARVKRTSKVAVAKELGVSDAAVHKRLRKIRERLRERD